MRIAIIDLDGVVCNVDARFTKAEEAKEAFLDANDYIGSAKDGVNLYWQTVFTPELVCLDTLIDGVKEALDAIRFKHSYQLIFLTSRPESMREATANWLFQHNILYYIDGREALVMKQPAFQYTKTTVWKAGMVQTLEALYGATDLLVIDDEQSVISEHLKYFSNVQTRELCKSLAEAVAKLNGTWKEPDPFAPEE